MNPLTPAIMRRQTIVRAALLPPHFNQGENEMKSCQGIYFRVVIASTYADGLAGNHIVSKMRLV
jgi:hypothetical protein